MKMRENVRKDVRISVLRHLFIQMSIDYWSDIQYIYSSFSKSAKPSVNFKSYRMKKVFITIVVSFIGTLTVFSQFVPGTLESLGLGENREITANGLTQLYSVTGKYTLSADGAGTSASTYSIDVNKPNASATVYKAYFFGAPVWSYSTTCATLNGNAITWDGSAVAAWGCCNYYDDVTSIVAAVVDPAAPGIISIPMTECSYSDGFGLLVIFSDPFTFQKTIVIMFGGLSTTGDNFALTLAEPIDPIDPGAMLDMGLGISYSYQPSGQYSIIDINSQRLTTSAGGFDDGGGYNGGLITVGGIGDLNTNPPDPFATDGGGSRYDDELYSLLPLITNTTTNILVTTSNPSSDDNIFLAYFEISGAAIIGEGILLTQELDTNFVGTEHTVMALVQDDLGAPVEGESVTFTVISGPNMGATETVLTGADGKAWFTYLGDGGPGIDEIEACFFDDAGQEICSNVLEKVWIGGEDVPVSNWAIFIGIALIIGFAIFRFRK